MGADKQSGQNHDQRSSIPYAKWDRGSIWRSQPSSHHCLTRRLKTTILSGTQTGGSGLLKAFCSPVFDTSMARNPVEVTAMDYFNGKAEGTMVALTFYAPA